MYFSSNFSLQNYKIGPKKIKITWQNWKLKQSKTLKTTFYRKVFDLESAKYRSVKNNVKKQQNQNCALLWKEIMLDYTSRLKKSVLAKTVPKHNWHLFFTTDWQSLIVLGRKK